MARQKKLKGFLIRFGRYHIITDPVTKMQLSTGCTDPEAALMWRAERERLAQQPAIMKARLATVGEWLEKLIAHKAKRNRQATIDYHKGKCNPLATANGTLENSAEQVVSDTAIHRAASRHTRSTATVNATVVPLFRRSTDGTYRPVARVQVTPADILADLERPSRFPPDVAVPTVESLAAAARECVTRTVVGL